MNIGRISILAILLLGAATAHAGTVNRCMDGNGKVIYSDASCAENAAQKKELDIKPPPGDAAPESRTDWKSRNAEFEARRKARLSAEERENRLAIQAELARKNAEDQRKSQEARDLDAAHQVAARARRERRDAEIENRFRANAWRNGDQ